MFYPSFLEILTIIGFIIQAYNSGDTEFFEDWDVIVGCKGSILDKN